jgi:hypothetical protein
LPENKKRELEIQKAREEKEKIKLERAVIEKKREEKRKKKGVYAFELGRYCTVTDWNLLLVT